MFCRTILPHIGNAELGEPNSVIVIDNASLHWGDDEDGSTVNQLDVLIRSKGGRLLYTPPFCPRANACEDFFKAMNDVIKRDEKLAESDPEAAILEGLLAVGAEKATGYVLSSEKKVTSWLLGAADEEAG